MSSTEKSKKGFSISNIRRKVSFKRGNAGPPTDVTSDVDGDVRVAPQSSTSAVDSERMAQEEKFQELERELKESQELVRRLEKKAAQYENVSAELDDDSYDAAQMFQLKKELSDTREELAKYDALKQELTDTKQELAEFRAQNEELVMQQSRKSTRTDIQRIRAEKTTREEVERLHKELRQMERNTKSQTSMVEAQLKVSKDSLQRAAEKAQALQRRLDLVDKERMDLKLENQRLTRKLEKSDSYVEKKRTQMEAETHQMEIANLKRKTVKLEKQLSLSTMNLTDINELGDSFNIGKPIRSSSRPMSQVSSGTTSPIPMTLSEARIENLEKEVHTLEEQNSTLESQNVSLKDELSAAQQKATILIVQVEQLQAGIGSESQPQDVLTQLPQYHNSIPQQPVSNGDTRDEATVHQELQQEIAKLKKELENKGTELRVRVKEMKATNEELKRQVEELEMEKLRLELGEDEEEGEGEDMTDTEEDAKQKENGKPTEDAKPPQEDESEVKVLRERLMSLQDELHFVSQNNTNLQAKLEQQKKEAEVFVKSIESELSDVREAEEERTREEKLVERNEELKNKLREQQDTCSDMIRETARLKSVLTDQVCMFVHAFVCTFRTSTRICTQ